jgi:GMP synthase-like glutamine amidotransferase
MLLIIDNHKKNEKAYLLKHLPYFLRQKRVIFKIKHLRKVSLKDTKDVNGIILTGGSVGCRVGCDAATFDINHPVFQREINIIKKSKKPIFGICLGHQLICHAYGGKIKEMPVKKGWVGEIRIRKKNDIFGKYLRTTKVFHWNKWTVVSVGKDLEVLATSKDGIEAVKHKIKPIYGVQFHPIIMKGKTLENFLKLIQN